MSEPIRLGPKTSLTPAAPVPVPKAVVAPVPMTVEEMVKPPTVLLIGPAGTGKTYSLTSVIEAGLDLFVLGTEPNFLDTLLDSLRARGLPLARLHWHYVAPAAPGLDTMDLVAQNISELSYDSLTKMKSGIGKDQTQQFRKMLTVLRDFVDQKDGTAYGSVFNFGPSRAFAIDSLSGINVMAKDLMLGYKPTAHEGEWGVSMDLEERLIRKLTSDMRCMFILTGHIQKGINDLTGQRNFTVNALGNKLAPKLLPIFSEVVLAKRGTSATTFRWSTADADVDLKNRALPVSSDLSPTFVPIWQAYQKRLEQLKGESA